MSRYEGKIKVVGVDRMCFPIDPVTLEPTGASSYDAYAISDPDKTPNETISIGEWYKRLRKAGKGFGRD
jgi:hypothetical protein